MACSIPVSVSFASGYPLQPLGGHQSPLGGHQRQYEPQNVPKLPRSWAPALEYPRDANLGSGSFAKIFKVRDKITGEKFAMKVVERKFYAQRQMEPQLNMEIEAMRKCSGSGRTNNIVKLLDYAEENGNVFLRMELCSTSLETHASQQPCRRIPESECVGWALQLFSGLEELHSLGIAHRDIKPENLLFGADGKIKIVDFGWCAYIADMRRSKGALAGTFQFMAPEILEERPQSEAVDMWSSGATLLELLIGQPLITSIQNPTGKSATCPRQAASIRTQRVLAEIKQKCPLPGIGRPSHLSMQCWTFCQALLMPIASTRISLQNVLRHPWLQHQITRSTSWTPHPSTNIVNNLIVHDRRKPPRSARSQPRSWDGSTTASSGGTPPPVQRKVDARQREADAIHVPVLQVCNWGSMGAQQHIWHTSHQPCLMPLLITSPQIRHRM